MVYISASIMLVSLLLVLGIILHYIFIKKINKRGSFIIVEVVFVLLIILGMLVLNETADYYKTTMTISQYVQQNDQKNDTDDANAALIASLVSMQANTLTITGVIVTITSIVISMLTIYRERKTEINNEKLTQSIQKLENTEKMIQELAAISSVLLLNSGQQEVFVSIIQQEIEKLGEKSDNANVAYAHFHMILMNMYLFTHHYMIGKQNEYEEYDIIIEKANKIIDNDESTQLSRNFAYIERVHAAYQKLKNSTDYTYTKKKRERIEIFIDDAHKYLKALKKQKLDDINGHIANLTGLIELWTGIAKTRIQESDDSRDFTQERIGHYKEASKFFDIAIKLNENKIEFKNHQVVNFLRLADVSQGEEKTGYLEESKRICKEINKKHPQYLKSRINFADTIARQIRLKLNISNQKNSEVERVIFNYCIVNVNQNQASQIAKELNEAKEALQQAKNIDITYPNSYYKMVEILILEICSFFQNPSYKNHDKLIKELEENLREAKEKTPEITKIYIYEYSFLNLMEDYYSIKSSKKKNNPKNMRLEDLKKRKEKVVESIKNSK